jgi:wyosine [tRNA(Phe)-imidazoG37] synthetase (radical SAM superfamily)
LNQSFLTMNQIRKELEFPEVKQIISELRKTISMWKPSWETANAIVVSGNGEATLHPQIDILFEQIKAVRDELRPTLKIVLYTNAAQLATNKVNRATAIADERLIKLDAGNDATLKTINAPLVRMGLNKSINAIRKIKDVSIQSLFIGGPLTNMEEKQIDDWIEVLGMIAPKKIYIQTVRHQPQDNRVVPATEDQLHLIAQKVERRTGLRPLVFTR